MVELFLLAIGISLVVYSLIGIKKENEGFDSILDNEVNNLKKENSQIGAIRIELAESILDLQKEIEELREEIENFSIVKDISKTNDKINNQTNYETNYDINNEKKNIKDNEDKILLNYNMNRGIIRDDKLETQKLVKQRLDEGKSIEDISSEFAIGRGEILLIQNLKLK